MVKKVVHTKIYISFQTTLKSLENNHSAIKRPFFGGDKRVEWWSKVLHLCNAIGALPGSNPRTMSIPSILSGIIVRLYLH